LRGLEREEAPSREWVRARAERIADGTRRISAMIEELLDAAQLQSGRQLTLHIDRVDVGALVRDVVRARQSAADTGQIPLIFEGASGLEIRADPARLERVVDNVLTNAIKYSSPGNPVEVEVRRHDGGAMISIRDRGVGIPSDELGKIFTPFYRASTAREVPGIGIGLSGAKMIVDQHGGEITISSTPGHGTLVRIALPADLPSVH
jgi:signal transduction histidine kinase